MIRVVKDADRFSYDRMNQYLKNAPKMRLKVVNLIIKSRIILEKALGDDDETNLNNRNSYIEEILLLRGCLYT